ncbi:MAG: DnaA/Hda family protein [Elusimicrobiales bacterium]|jgi:chromosomal replication initiator protein
MIKKWDISPAPSEKNPARHKLLIKGEMRDIFLVVKKLGGLCSRPEKTAGDFNFVIYLSKMEPDTAVKIKSLEAELSDLSDTAPPRQAAGPGLLEPPRPGINLPLEEPVPPPVSERPAAAQLQPASVQPPEPSPVQEPHETAQLQPASARPQEAPPVPEPPPVQESPAAAQPQPVSVQPPEPSPVQEPHETAQPQPVPAPPPEPSPVQPPPLTPPSAPEQGVNAPQALPPAFAKPMTESIRGIPFVPSAVFRAKAEASRPEEKPEAVSKPQETAKTPGALRIRAKWSVELPLVPTYKFQTLVSGSHNRFAHAAAMAVVENPGMIYNPLLVFGVPGTGKTHFVHSISYGLSSSIGQDKIFVTDGIKLSKGIDIAVKDGTIDRLEEVISKVKALVIDDIHLLMLTETNKKYISRWLNDFLAKNKQIMVTSVFPPKSLGGLEEAVGFQFTQGWMVDLKSPTPQTYKAILAQLLQGMDIKLSEDESGRFFASKGVPFGEVVRTLEGMKKLEKFIVNGTQAASHARLLEMLLGLGERADGSAVTEAEYGMASGWKPSMESSWFKWGIFYPRTMKKAAQYVLYRMHERSMELGLKIEWQQVFMEEYSQDEIYGTPSRLGNFATEKNVNGVIVLGPHPTSALGAQESEFRHVTMKILESFLVKSAWIQAGHIKSQAAYAQALMDLS